MVAGGSQRIGPIGIPGTRPLPPLPLPLAKSGMLLLRTPCRSTVQPLPLICTSNEPEDTFCKMNLWFTSRKRLFDSYNLLNCII